MAKRKLKRNEGRWKPRGGFKICREPGAHLSAHGPSDPANSISLSHVQARPFLFAIARDATPSSPPGISTGDPPLKKACPRIDKSIFA